MLSPVSRNLKFSQLPAVPRPGEHNISVLLQKTLQRARRRGRTVYGGVLSFHQLRYEKKMIQMTMGDADIAHPFKIFQRVRIASSIQFHKGIKQQLLPARLDENGRRSKPGYCYHGFLHRFL